MKVRVAILGSTGQIGRALAELFLDQNGFEVYLFSRKPGALSLPYKSFGKYQYEVVVNCIGFGTPAALRRAGMGVFRITERFDNLVLRYLAENQDTLYVNLSSGAVYSTDVNDLSNKDSYAVAKIYTETKHRCLKELKIVDLRVFSFISSFIDENSGFFIAEVIKSIKEKSVFRTDTTDITRDYCSPEDLLQLILLCYQKGRINECFDVYTKSPITKFELLQFFEDTYGLRYTTDRKIEESPTRVKVAYFSKNKKAETIGYIPKFSSIENISKEIKKIF